MDRYLDPSIHPSPEVERRKDQKTYSRKDSLVVTDPTTNFPIGGLIQDERTGIHALHRLWPYVMNYGNLLKYILASAYLS